MKSAITALSLVLIAGPAVAGVVFEVETKDHEQSPPKTDELQMIADGKNISMDIQPSERGGKGGKVIFRGDKGDGGEVVVVDDDGKSYFVMDRAAMAAIGGQVSAAMKQVDEMLKNLPKEQQDAIRKARGGMMPGPPKRESAELRKTSDTGDKNGYPCVKYEVLRGGRKVRELWVTDWDNVEGGAEVVGAFEEMAAFFREMMAGIPNMGGGGGGPADIGLGEMGFDKGFPVVTREFDEDGSLESESALRSAKRQTIDPDAFEPPSGYKRQEMFRQ